MTEARPDQARPDAERAVGRSSVAEPEFLAARRERAARLMQELELPNFKGRAGWEFTDISALDLAAFAPSPAQAAPASEPRPLFDLPDAGGALPDGVVVCAI